LRDEKLNKNYPIRGVEKRNKNQVITFWTISQNLSMGNSFWWGCSKKFDRCGKTKSYVNSLPKS